MIIEVEHQVHGQHRPKSGCIPLHLFNGLQVNKATRKVSPKAKTEGRVQRRQKVYVDIDSALGKILFNGTVNVGLNLSPLYFYKA